jgi:hypothetical protein
MTCRRGPAKKAHHAGMPARVVVYLSRPFLDAARAVMN